MPDQHLSIALLDMYDLAPNEGMRCIQELIEHFCQTHSVTYNISVYPVRSLCSVPGLNHDVYISSGGPGSPLITGKPWIYAYQKWLFNIQSHNKQSPQKKAVFFICYSFQLACRFLNIGNITKRNQTSFGIFPIEMIDNSHPLFEGLKDSFQAFDNRDYQVIHTDSKKLPANARVIALEHLEEDKSSQKAVMGMEFDANMFGTQFHPEADSQGMLQYLQREERKQQIINSHGEEKWYQMIQYIKNPDALGTTRDQIIPNFLRMSLHLKYPEA